MSFRVVHDATNTAATRHRAALVFIEQHQAQHLDNDQLIRRCASHVMTRFHVPEHVATDAALHALAEIQAQNTPARVNIDRSTMAVVMVTDPRNGRTFAFTASELLELATSKAPPAANDPVRLVAVCGRRAD